MKNISVSKDIIPVGEFKAGLAKYLNEVNSNNNSLIITQNGKPAGVLISPSQFDELCETKALLASVSRGLSDLDEDRVYSSAQLRKELAGSGKSK